MSTKIITTSSLNGHLYKDILKINQRGYYNLPTVIQDFEADFLWKVSLKILNSGIILKIFTHAFRLQCLEELGPIMEFEYNTYEFTHAFRLQCLEELGPIMEFEYNTYEFKL